MVYLGLNELVMCRMLSFVVRIELGFVRILSYIVIWVYKFFGSCKVGILEVLYD